MYATLRNLLFASYQKAYICYLSWVIRVLQNIWLRTTVTITLQVALYYSNSSYFQTACNFEPLHAAHARHRKRYSHNSPESRYPQCRQIHLRNKVYTQDIQWNIPQFSLLGFVEAFMKVRLELWFNYSKSEVLLYWYWHMHMADPMLLR